MNHQTNPHDSSRFFNNEGRNTLFEKFKGIAQGMGSNFNVFQAVSGFFRSSGYFKLREVLKDVGKIQILIGINIDDIFKEHSNEFLWQGIDESKAKEAYTKEFISDVCHASYSPEVEKGIDRLHREMIEGRVELRIHSSKNLHAKFYLCLPEQHSPHTDGWVIMGSSNISDSGLGTTVSPRYELNVAMKDYTEVAFCKAEFERLWTDSVPVSPEDVDQAMQQTYLGFAPTPYELYMKMLIDAFGDQVEDDFTMQLPDDVIDLKYQRDAAVQGFQMLIRHNGFFLGDVVGLGKTVVAAMVAKRFIEANGKDTKILVVYPPAVESNWKETFKNFDIHQKTQYVSNGSLFKVLDDKESYHSVTEYDLIIVDESHNFRNDSNNRYGYLQKICKASRAHTGRISGSRKKVMLLSATALNNYPNDLYNQICLFQDARNSTWENVSNLQDYFVPRIERYNEIIKRKGETTGSVDVQAIDTLFTEIRNDLLAQITVRRTRQNLLNDPIYSQDLTAQKVIFPQVKPPETLRYSMSDHLRTLFWETLDILANKITYARYRAIEFLVPPYCDKYQDAGKISLQLANIYRNLLVKRLESSFYAFRQSLATFAKITDDMIQMFASNKVLIAPELNVKDLLAQGLDLDSIIEKALAKGYAESDIVYPIEAFTDKFLPMLHEDAIILRELITRWENVDEDPKLELFLQAIETRLFDPSTNPTGKLVIFAESVDTGNYLSEKLKERLKRDDILQVNSKNRNDAKETITRCFDANVKEQDDAYNILVTSDVLAEGINLHRANVIINYDIAWNAIRLLQRIGRVNRIGSKAATIENYMFYPSEEGNQIIKLYQKSLTKLQAFHSALGEDTQIFSSEEVLREFENVQFQR